MAKEAIQLKVEKIDKPKRNRKPKQKGLKELLPASLYRLLMIPYSRLRGWSEGICAGYVKSLEVALEIYKKELGK